MADTDRKSRLSNPLRRSASDLPAPTRQAFTNVRQRIERLAENPLLLDIRQSVAVMAAYHEMLLERLEDNDSPQLRTRALGLLQRKEYDALLALLKKGVEWDATWKKLVEVAEKEATLQARAAELYLKSENSLSARNVVALMRGFLSVVQKETDQTTYRKIVARVSREIMGGDARIAIEIPRQADIGSNGHDETEESAAIVVD